MFPFFKSEKVTDGLTAIHSLSGEIMYLIEGSKSALLIDTSVGIKGYREFVESLTKLPYTVALTHGHVDHAMGAPEFDEVYMSHKDLGVYEGMRDVAGRMGYVAGMPGGAPEGLTEDDFVPPSDYAFKKLKDGDCFDLGDVHVDAYAYPGHTTGSMAFLIREMRILITGDACNNFVLLAFDHSTSVSEYRASTKRLMEQLEGAYDRIFMSHRELDAPVDLLAKMIEVCDAIIAGKDARIPHDCMGFPSCMAKKIDFETFEIEGGIPDLVYDPNRI